MKMPLLSYLLLVLFDFPLMGVVAAESPQAPELALSWDVQVDGGQYLAERGRAYRVLGEWNELELTMSLENAGFEALIFNEAMVRAATQIRLVLLDEGGAPNGQIPVTVTWVGVLEPDVPGPLVTVPDQEFVVEARNGVMWSIRVARTDGEMFSVGQYRIEIGLNNVRSGVRPADGGTLPEDALRQWSGEMEGRVDVVVHVPATQREYAAMYLDRGHVAFARQQFDDARALYAQAADSDPTQTEALYYLGGAYLRLGRYAEAIGVLRKLPMPGDRSTNALLLAQAYVGIGNEAEARSLLGNSGYDEVQRAATIEQMRQFVRTRPAR